MKKKIIGFVIGIFSLSIISTASATELKLATFEPPKAFIASKILAAWADKVNKCSNGALNVKMYAGGVLGSPPKQYDICLLYTSPSPRDATLSRMPSSA